MSTIIAVASQKGGVGKTTLAMNIAAIAAEFTSVLLVDVDEQQSSTDWFANIPEDDRTFLVNPTTDRGTLAQLKALDYDLVIVDCPGNLTGGGVIPTVLSIADLAVLVTDTKYLSLPPLTRSITQVVGPAGTDYRVVINNIDMVRGGQVEEADVRGALAEHGIPVFKSGIRAYKTHERAPLEGQVVPTYPEAKAATAAGTDMRRFVAELLNTAKTSSDVSIDLTEKAQVAQ